MKKLRWFLVLPVMALLMAGCAKTVSPTTPPLVSGMPTSGYHKGMESLRWLTEIEKAKVIDIALNTPEALKNKETYGTYKTMLGWVGIVWLGNHASELGGLD